MTIFLLTGLAGFLGTLFAPLAAALARWLVAGPLLPWLLVPAGLGLGGVLLLELLTILDG